jgi:hypothetical protein
MFNGDEDEEVKFPTDKRRNRKDQKYRRLTGEAEEPVEAGERRIPENINPIEKKILRE